MLLQVFWESHRVSNVIDYHLLMVADNPLISVIIPVYNGEKYIRLCLEDMQSQSYENLEIIVVNDGSTDRSAELIAQYPVKVIHLPENRGLSAARNSGMDAATGTYVHFMDVDDSINPDFYREMAAAVSETDADIACSGMINEIKPHRTMLFEKQRVLTTVQEKLKATNVGKWGYVWRYLFRADFLKQHGLRFEEGRLIEDLPFSLPAVFFAKSVVVVPGAVYTYRLQENSIMTKKDKAHRQRRRRDIQYVKSFRQKFARQHRIRIPGVPTGRISYLYVKWLT